MASSIPLIGGVEIAKIPVDTDTPWYSYKILLSSTLYTLRLRFNSRMQRWILDVADSQNGSLINSIPLLILRNLSGRFSSAGVPPGFFFCVDNTGEGNQPGRFSFSTSHTCYYFDETGTTF